MEKFNLIEVKLDKVELDEVETLEDTIAPAFGIFCRGCTNASAFGVFCG